MTKKDKDTWTKRKDAQNAGYNPEPWRGLQIHSHNRARHEFTKFTLAWVLDDKDREWDTEVVMKDGRVDVYDFGPTDGKPVIYEVETGVSDPQRKRKVEQYCKGPVRDVIVLDPADVPARFDEAIEYIETQVIL